MKRIIIILTFLCIAGSLKAQDTTPRNSIIAETNLIATTSISYNRIIPKNDNLSIMYGGSYIMGTGFGYGSHWLGAEAGLLLFGPKHFLETGAQFVYGINDDSSPGLKIAYRLQCKKGFTFRTTANILFNIDPVFLPAVGFGYSF